MKLLVGSTGLIGTTLKDSVNFDYEFNSKNLSDLLTVSQNSEPLDLYLCCLPATKWLINKEPLKDFQNMISILKILEQRSYRKIVVYSTIDIYTDAPTHSTEDYKISIEAASNGFNYGNNRHLFEHLVKAVLKWEHLLVVRLPALIGKHLKKNILYDLLTNNQIDKIGYNTKYQWYDLNNLAEDTERYLTLLDTDPLTYKSFCVNLFSEPVDTASILKVFGVDKSQVDTSTKPVAYDYKTKHTPSGYIADKQSILKTIEVFYSSSKSL